MKNKFASSFFLGFAALLSAASLSGCSEVEDVLTLRLLNCEDYIGEDEFEFTDENGKEYTFDDVLSGFEEYESERLGKTVRIVYDTYDTNETMLSSLKTGKSTYDLIVASDYTIQKMMNLEMLQKIDFAKVPNYVDYVSPYLNAQLEGLTAVVEGKEETVKDYSIGYMWGTLGILYNPSKIARDKRMDEEEVKFAMNDWNSLWNPAFYGEMSVKDSMRDTYSIGILKEFDQEIKSLTSPCWMASGKRPSRITPLFLGRSSTVATKPTSKRSKPPSSISRRTSSGSRSTPARRTWSKA